MGRCHRRVLSKGAIWTCLQFSKVTLALPWGVYWSREQLKPLGLGNQNSAVAVQARNDGDSNMGLEWHGGNRVSLKRAHPLRALCAMLRMLRFHPVGNKEPLKGGFFFLSFFFFFFFCLFFRAAPAAYGGSQDRSWIGAVGTGLHHSHSNTRSKLHLRTTLQLTAMPDP